MPRPSRRFPLVLLALAALFVPGSAFASTAPTTPTFALKWGTTGTAPGQLNRPRDIATDAQGNVYVADVINSRIQKFDKLGNFILQWGSNGGGSGQFHNVGGIGVDASGNVYASDQNDNRIQKFTSTGVYLSQWGSAGSGDGQFNQPAGMAIDPAGNIYVCEYSGNRVQKFSGDGTFLAKWGTSGTGNGQFNGPDGLAADNTGHIYVTDFGTGTYRVQQFTNTGVFVAQLVLSPSNDKVCTDPTGNLYVSNFTTGQITKFTITGTVLAQWGGLGTGDGQFSGASGLVSDPAGNIYVNDYLGNRVEKFSGAGTPAAEAPPTFLLKWGTCGSAAGQISGAWALCPDAANSVYVTDTNNNRIERFLSTGAYLSQFGGPGSGPGQFNHPSGVWVDAAGNVYVTDQANNRVQKFNSSGVFTLQWGATGTANGQFNGPVGIVGDAGGNLYVSDYSNNRIQKFSSTGAFLTKWGTAGSGDGQFNGPFGVTVDAAGNVYVAEQFNHRVQKFTSTGAFLTKWGTNGAAPGQFFQPTGIAADPFGNVFVMDYGNDRIQKFTGNGTFLSQLGTIGSGNSQFAQPIGVAVDAAGNLYASDTDNCRIQRFVQSASIALVSDVGNDQGRQAMIRFVRSSADAPLAPVAITGYEIYRRNDALPPGSLKGAETLSSASPAGIELAGWTYVATAPAHGESEYNVVVPTLVDATNSSLEYSAFLVRAASTDPFTFYDSGVENGFSMDNLAPPVPTPFLAAYAGSVTHLHWGLSPAADFATFRLYRGSSPDFIPGVGNFVTAQPDTGFDDAGIAGRYYKLSAVDRNGNESHFALVGPGQTTAVPVGSELEFALHSVSPNPVVGGRMMVNFALPSAQAATLELIDISGRRVASRDVGSLGAGFHAVDLAEGRRLAAGVYLVRLQQGANTRVIRAAVLK